MERTFTITCYGKTTTYKERERKKQIREFREAADWSEGCERERYVNILFDLIDGRKHCKDEY